MNNFVAPCPLGGEHVAGEEVKRLGYTLLEGSPGRVRFLGDGAERANLLLRSVDRVYIEVARFHSEDFDALFEGVSAVPWEAYFFKNTKVTIDKVRTNRSRLKSVPAVQSITQKALYERLMKKWGLVSLSESGSEVRVRVHIERDEASLLLDTTGAALHKRGEKDDGGAAPLRETLAFSMLQKMHWRRKRALRDPFCGGGTIPLEAAMYAQNVPAGLLRHFAFENLAIYDEARFQSEKAKAASAVRSDIAFDIIGSDIDNRAVRKAIANANVATEKVSQALQALGVSAKITPPRFECCDFSKANYEGVEPVVLCHPPFGKRLGSEDEAVELYKRMSTLNTLAPKCDIGVITNYEDFEEVFGRRADKNGTLKAGNFDTRFFEFFTQGGVR